MFDFYFVCSVFSEPITNSPCIILPELNCCLLYWKASSIPHRLHIGLVSPSLLTCSVWTDCKSIIRVSSNLRLLFYSMLKIPSLVMLHALFFWSVLIWGSLSSGSVHGGWKLWNPEDPHRHTQLMLWQRKGCWELLDLRPLKEGPHCSELPCGALGMCNATPTWGLVSDPWLVP